MSLLTEHDFDLDEYRQSIPPGDYRVVEVDGHLYSLFPVGPSLLALPIVLMVETFSEDVLRVPFTDVMRAQPAGVEKLCGSVFVAATALLIFALARRRLGDVSSLLVVFIFAFCTSSWSVVSRALWQHGPSMLLLSAALWVLLRARDEPRVAPYAGLFLAAAYAMRPTNALPLVLLTIYVAVEHRSWLWRYLGWAALVMVPLLGYDVATFGKPLPWYYWRPGSFRLPGAGFLEGAAGTLISPGRGLLIYSPVFLLSCFGVVLLIRQGRWRRLDSFLCAWLALHWLVVSSYDTWWGGAIFGPRLFADVIPVLMYFLIPVVERLQTPGRARWPLATALGLTVVASFVIHRAGATDYGPWEWNVDRTFIDTDPSRLWDWRDPPFLRREGEHVIVPPPPPQSSAEAQRKAERRRRREAQRAKPPVQSSLPLSFVPASLEEVAQCRRVT